MLIAYFKLIIVSGSDNGIIKLYDIINGDCIKTIMAHSSSVNCIVKITEFQIISGGGSPGEIKIWNLINLNSLNNLNDQETEDCLNITKLMSYTKYVNCLLKFDNSRLISVGSNNSIIIWNLKNGYRLTTLTGNSDNIFCLVKLNETIIASGSIDSINIWDIENKNCLRIITGFNGIIRCLIKLNKTQLVIGGIDLIVKAWKEIGESEVEESEEKEKEHDSINIY